MTESYFAPPRNGRNMARGHGYARARHLRGSPFWADEAISSKGKDKRAYAKELKTKGFDNVIKIVVVSDGKKVWVKEL